MKLAILCDYLNQYGGAERIVETIHKLYPSAPIYTLIYDESNMPDRFRKLDIRTSFLQKLPGIKRHYEKYLPLYPTAVEQWNLKGYDVVFSISSAWCKGAITSPNTIHINYCLSPMRFIWDEAQSSIKERTQNRIQKLALPFIFNYLRIWDVSSTRRIDRIITISNFVRDRIRKYYRRKAEVIYPPVDCSFFTPSSFNKEDISNDYFLVVSRLKPYKRVDLAIEAFNELGFDLVIVGDGSEKDKLKNIAKDNIKFVGKVSDEELREYYRNCKALIFPGVEDFGIVPLEAQACGIPVIAYRKGGATETITDETGVFFDEQSKSSLISAIKNFEKKTFNKETIRKQAEKFDTLIFEEKINQILQLKI